VTVVGSTLDARGPHDQRRERLIVPRIGLELAAEPPDDRQLEASAQGRLRRRAEDGDRDLVLGNGSLAVAGGKQEEENGEEAGCNEV
jgi:hypothetical protein